MEILAGKTLIRKNGQEVSSEEALANVDVICFYFSAHWCGPCVEFTPVLAKVYAASKEAGNSLEVVFVSADNSEKDMRKYMTECHGDWFAIKFGDDLVSDLQTKFDIDGFPTLVVVGKDGKIIESDGVCDIGDRGIEVVKEWLKPKE